MSELVAFSVVLGAIFIGAFGLGFLAGRFDRQISRDARKLARPTLEDAAREVA